MTAHAYATTDDVLALYPEDTINRLCWNKQSNLPDYDKLQIALYNAATEIDSYLSTRFPVPVTPTPQILRQVNIDLSIYYLALTIDRLSNEISKRAEDWRKWLVMVAKGQVGLGVLESDSNSDSTPAEGTDTMSGVTGKSVRV